MGFFDQLSKKAAETVQGAKDKTSKISSEMKLKSRFAEGKDKISLLYIEIGKEIYSNYTKGEEKITDSITGKCKEISNINDELRQINKELLAVRDIKICPSCGSQVPTNSEFCPKCGVKQVEVVEDVKKEAKEAEVVEVKDADTSEEKEEKKED